MSSNQDLFMALQMLDKGVTQFATSRAVNDANDQVRQINENYTDETQKVQGLRDVANGLTRRLAGLGTDAATINQVAESIGPRKAPVVQSPFQGMLADLDLQVPADQEEAVKRSKDYIDRSREAKQYGSILKDQNKVAKEGRATLTKFQGQFAKFYATTDKARNQAETALKLLDSGNPIAPSAIKTLMAKASGEVGNLTETEREAFAGVQDLPGVLKRFMSVKSSSELPEADKKALRQLAQLYSQAAGASQEEYADMLSGQLQSNELFSNVPADELIGRISGGRVQRRKASAPQAAGGGAPAGNAAPTWQKYKK